MEERQLCGPRAEEVQEAANWGQVTAREGPRPAAKAQHLEQQRPENGLRARGGPPGPDVIMDPNAGDSVQNQAQPAT